MLFDDLFEEQGKSFIVDQDGNLITKDKQYEKKHKLNIVDNLFNVCNQKKIKTDFKKQKSDLILTQTKKERIFIFSLFPAKNQ